MMISNGRQILLSESSKHVSTKIVERETFDNKQHLIAFFSMKLQFRNDLIFIWKRVASSLTKGTEVERTIGHARQTSWQMSL